MSDQLEPEDGRAADAFRSALSRHADEVTADVALPTRPAPRRGRWVAAGAALAVAASAVVGFAVLDRDRPGDGLLDPAGDPPVIAEGWRGVTFRDVTVQVPEEWGDGYAPGDDWCADVPRDPQEGPFVDIRASGGFSFAIGCSAQDPVPAGFPPEPEAQWVPHVSLVDLASADAVEIPDGTTTHDGWTLRARTLGDVQVRLLTDAATEDVADEILTSAQRSEVSALGCDTTSPVQARPQPRHPGFSPGGDLAALDVEGVEALLVCQYERLGTDGPGLLAERRADRSEAQMWLAAVQAAPRSGGPDSPHGCLDAWDSEMGEVVFPLAADGTRLAAAYVTADACAGNGLRDAATTYALTDGTCAPLFSERVVWWGGPSAVGRVCMPARD